MSVVYVHNFTFKSRSEAMGEFGAQREKLAQQAFWNIWQVRAHGWKLADGDRVLLVGAWTERAETYHRVTWEVEATDVRKWEGVKDWNKATSELGKWTGWGSREVRSNGYTQDKQVLAGPLYVLAWRAIAKTWIDIDLPPGVRIGRNGWSTLDSSVVDSWAHVRPDLERKAKAAARRLEATAADENAIAEQVAVALRARQVAQEWLTTHGWTINTRTGYLGTWDDRGTDPKGSVWRISVTGSTTAETAFKLSSESQRQYEARQPRLLIAVHSIQVDATASAPLSAVGGIAVPFVRWTSQTVQAFAADG
jgi:hypothetical protein